MAGSTNAVYLYMNDGTDTRYLWDGENGSSLPPLPTIETIGWSREGYSFVEWNSSSDGSSTSYSPGSNFNSSGGGALYAIWEEQTASNDVIITYKNSTIASMDESGSKIIQTAGKYCEGNIGVRYNKPASNILPSATGVNF